MPIEKIRPAFAFDEDRLDELKQIVPEAFADGKVNWDVLRHALGDYLEDTDEEIERFGLFWPGKREARRIASMPSDGTLIPQSGLGVDAEYTHNTFVEGDNLEVLKLLQKSYANRVKMIYIDPPYNTGNDFVYEDDYSEPLESYLRRTGQASEKGELLTTNTRSSGRFHSNWLSMMYPRLLLARQLLAQDGVVFVSIDDNEIHHLRVLMDEVFGAENFVDTIVWEKVHTRKNSALYFSSSHDYILCYAKLKQSKAGAPGWARNLLPRKDTSAYSNPDDDPRGPWKTDPIYANKPYSADYKIVKPNGVELGPPEGQYWRFSEEKWKDFVEKGAVRWGQSDSYPTVKRYLSDVQDGLVPVTLFERGFAGDNADAKEELDDLLGVKRAVDYPKPHLLIRRLLQIGTNSGDSDIVLDFFAGSCTTAHAVLLQNRHDGGNRRFIMVQLPEPTDEESTAREAGYDTIADIGRARIRQVIACLRDEDEGKLGLHEGEDLGFKCYRLARSNYKPWRDVTTPDVAQIEMAFDRFETPLVEDWQRADLYTEILLIEGFPLDSAVTRQQHFRHNQVNLVISDFHEHRLLVCLDETIAPQTVSELDLADTDVFVCLDAALSDEAKVRLSDTGNIHVI